jgi:hypothetical protein
MDSYYRDDLIDSVFKRFLPKLSLQKQAKKN